MKKGFTIIEVVIGVALIGCIAIVEIKVLSISLFKYEKKFTESKLGSYGSKALLFIESQLWEQDAIERRALENIIEIKKENNKIDLIKIKNESLIIEYREAGRKVSENVIINKIKSFEAVQRGQVIYVCITNEKDKKFERYFLLSK